MKYLDTGNITENQIDTLQIFQKGEKLPSRAKRKVEKGTIIYSTVRPNQKHFGYFDTHSNDLVVSTGFATLDVIDPRINSKYLYYLLTQNSVISQLQSIGENSTSSYPSIRPEDIGNLSFVFPDIDIQNKIADILTSIDKKIQTNNQINQELEAMAKTLYDYWFVQFDFPDQNGKPYKSSGGKMVYNPELKREIPEGWGVEDLKDFESKIITGKTPSRANSDNFGGEIPFITIGDIRGNTFIYRTSESLTDLGANVQQNKYLPEGSLCVSCIATVGEIGFTTEWSHTNQQINSIVFEDETNRYYLYFALKNYFENANASAKTGNTFANMNKEDFSGIRIILPSKEIKKNFHKISEPYFAQIKCLQGQNQQLTKLRDWLLPMLMNGQVKVE
ncbi:restriction endonuclease subunit S [Streptococcus thermophilus]|nr:restriction endonuclease subunit S [Streptococcus thermophilus]